MFQNDPLKLPPFHFDADPDPAFHFDADPDTAFHFDPDPDTAFHFNGIRMRIQLPKMMRIQVDQESSISMFTCTNLGLVEIIRVKTVIAVFEPMMCNSF
jgi:hypothetical protein